MKCSSLRHIAIAVTALLPLTAVAAEELRGAGSTFISPILSRWSDEYHRRHPAVQVTYEAIGSGGGLRRLHEGRVRFAITDVPFSDAEVASLSTPVAQVPIVGAAIAILYHLPQLKSPLRLTGPLLAEIFLGNVSRWDDPRIAAVNAGIDLPAVKIVVHRSDGSSTNYAFTQYLSAVSANWHAKVGAGKSVEWPVGLGGKGCEGVAAVAKSTPGAITYDELAYAVQNRIPYARIRNRSGRFVAPSTDAVTAAMAGALPQLRRDLRTPIADPRGDRVYPICSLVYAVVPRTTAKAERARDVREFLSWIVGARQVSVPAELHYAPLPEPLRMLSLDALSR